MSSSRRVFVLLLGAFLALGISLSAVQASAMAVKMMTMSGMGSSGHCNEAPAKKMTTCSFGCVAPVLAVIPQTAPTSVLHAPVPLLREATVLLGRALSPDPHPPRSGDLA